MIFIFLSLNYLKKVAGPRTVPVELGSRYTDDDWSQQLMTIKMFIENYIEHPVSTYICLCACVCMHVHYICVFVFLLVCMHEGFVGDLVALAHVLIH